MRWINVQKLKLKRVVYFEVSGMYASKPLQDFCIDMASVELVVQLWTHLTFHSWAFHTSQSNSTEMADVNARHWVKFLTLNVVVDWLVQFVFEDLSLFLRPEVGCYD